MTARAEMLQATREGILKRRLEAQLVPLIRPLFSRLALQFRISVSSTGGIPGQAILEAGISDWRAILMRHYERVQRAFSGMVVTEQEIKQEDNLDDDLREALLIWRTMASERSSKNIMSTSEKNMREALNQAHAELLRMGLPSDNRSVVALGVAILKRKFKGRLRTIAMFETQQSAENAKFSEAETISGVRPSQITGQPSRPVPTSKIWRNMQDERVRPAPGQDPRFNHRIPEGQDRNIYQPFDVSGEKLMYPGDVSLGASRQNVINCRCASIYRVSRPQFDFPR